jgi:hypothetical protein
MTLYPSPDLLPSPELFPLNTESDYDPGTPPPEDAELELRAETGASEELVYRFRPLLTPDLETFLRIGIGSMFWQVASMLSVDDDDGNWVPLLDPDACPEAFLPYLAQFVGERIRVGLSESQKREWIKDAPIRKRGTVMSIFQAAQRTLIGGRTVALQERFPNVDTISVVTYAPETPDPELVEHDLRDVVPADIVLNYQSLTGQTWALLMDAHADWQAVSDAYDTWGEVASDPAGANVYTRPPA